MPATCCGHNDCTVHADGPSPLNVYSKADEELGRLLSNFAHTPFVMDGITYASVEGFYSSLFWPEGDQGRRAAVALSGGSAKAFRPEPAPVTLIYRGRFFAHRSPEHVTLVERAIRAKLIAHPAIADGLAASGDRPIVHEIHGVAQDPALCEILTRIRAELQAVQR